MAISLQEKQELLNTLKTRFEANMNRHEGLAWPVIQAKLEASPKKLDSLFEMERTGGEPDVIAYDKKSDEYTFYDCSSESPSGRRSLCYDRAALDARKKFKPENCALDVAKAMGVSLLTEAQYRELQNLGNFDCKTSSWLLTPAAIRAEGGAIFGDFRYKSVFIYHNGADSYYAARGFRALLKV
jgi:hypothetical protein